MERLKVVVVVGEVLQRVDFIMEASFIEEAHVRMYCSALVISVGQLPCLIIGQTILILAMVHILVKRFIVELMVERLKMLE